MGRVYRKGRLGEEIRRIVSNMLLKEIKDPRLSGGIVTVSGVEVTEDGSYATIFITKLGNSADEEISSEEKNDVLAAFKSAKGLIRREIGADCWACRIIIQTDTSRIWEAYLKVNR